MNSSKRKQPAAVPADASINKAARKTTSPVTINSEFEMFTPPSANNNNNNNNDNNNNNNNNNFSTLEPVVETQAATPGMYCCCGGLSKDPRCKSKAEGGEPMLLANRLGSSYHQCSRTGDMVWNGFCLYGSETVEDLNDLCLLTCLRCFEGSIMDSYDDDNNLNTPLKSSPSNESLVNIENRESLVIERDAFFDKPQTFEVVITFIKRLPSSLKRVGKTQLIKAIKTYANKNFPGTFTELEKSAWKVLIRVSFNCFYHLRFSYFCFW